MNKKYKTIARNIKNKCECDIEMYVQDGDNISLYNFHQIFVEGEPIWDVQKLEKDVWRLSEAAISFENKNEAKRKLIPKQ